MNNAAGGLASERPTVPVGRGSIAMHVVCLYIVLQAPQVLPVVPLRQVPPEALEHLQAHPA